MLSEVAVIDERVWSVGSYERIAERFAPVHDQLANVLALRPGERVLDLATGTGEVAIRAARAGATVTALDIAAPMLEKARRRADEEGVDVRVRPGRRRVPAVRRRVLRRRRLELRARCSRPTTRTSPPSSRASRGPAARLGFTAWKPNPKLGELYRRFTEEPIEGREAYEWGREDHVEDMLGDEFELEFEDGTLWLEADVRRGGLEALLRVGAAGGRARSAARRRAKREEFHGAFVELYEGYRTKDGRDPGAAPLPARARQAQVIRARSPTSCSG